MNQTYKNLEIIIIDDGSEDNSYKLIKNIAKKDNRIKYIRQLNQGASGARNTGLKNISGEFVFFLDSDDWIESFTIEKLVEKIIIEKSDLVMPDRYNKITLEQRVIEEHLFEDYDKYTSLEEFVVNIIIAEGRAWRVSSVLYRSDIIKENNIFFPEGHTAEDLIFNLRYLKHSNKISILKMVTLNVNKRIDSVTSTYRENMLETYMFIDAEAINYIRNTECNFEYSQTAIDSLLCRNIILLIHNEMSSNNKQSISKKIEYILF